MRKLLVSVALATATLAAVPAAAQYHNGGWDQRGDYRNDRRDDDRFDRRDDYRFDRRGDFRSAGQLMQQISQVEFRVDRLAQRRLISRGEAFNLRREADMLRNRIHWSSRNGIDRREFAQFSFQIDRLERHALAERGDFDRGRF